VGIFQPALATSYTTHLPILAVQHSGHQAGLSSSVILQLARITSLGATKPECNGLSQFDEDTVPVREFNLTAYPLHLAYMNYIAGLDRLLTYE